jgi:hypothetical protein
MMFCITLLVLNKYEGINGVWRHFQQYFSYIMAVSFIGGGNLTEILLKVPPNTINALVFIQYKKSNTKHHTD